MISTKQSVDFATYPKKQLIRFCKKFHKDCYRLVGQKMALRDKITELEEQIEKMKCCHNCKNCAYAGFEIICRTYDCINQSKWEIKE